VLKTCIWPRKIKAILKSDSEITEEAVVYAATECIDPVTLEKLKSLWSMKNFE